MDTVTIRSPIGALKITADGTHIRSLECTGTIKNTDTKSALLLRCIKELEEYFGGKRLHFTVPIQTKGTPFQQSVWGTMSTIGHGRTISYAALAKAIKRPKAFRAVANACGKNPLLIVVPCHRVVQSNGTMGGYSGGVGKKKWLLSHESSSYKSPKKSRASKRG